MNFNDLFQGGFENWELAEWLIVGLGALIIIVLLALLLKPKKKKTVAYKQVQTEPKAATSDTKAPKEVLNESFETKDEAKKDEVKAEPKKAQVKTVAQKVEAPQEAESEKVVKYHVSQNKDAKSEFKNQWRVRKEGSRKTIKYFKTQAEAIKYAESLAENNDTSIVIHKRDGTIRKQDYTKKKSS